MKIGFVVTAHYSDEHRPNGGELITNFCSTLNSHCKVEFRLYVVDNASTKQLTLPENANVIRIEDQMLEGITGAWNKGMHYAYSDGCELILNCSDDMLINDSIHKLIDFIESHDGSENFVYSALTDGTGLHAQFARKPGVGTTILEHCNGFFFAMTRDHYEKYRFTTDKYFNIQNAFNGGDGKWGGQEGQFIENHKKGASCLIVRECWLPHKKVRGWVQLRGK